MPRRVDRCCGNHLRPPPGWKEEVVDQKVDPIVDPEVDPQRSAPSGLWTQWPLFFDNNPYAWARRARSNALGGFLRVGSTPHLDEGIGVPSLAAVC